MFELIYDIGIWDTETIHEKFHTVEELLERYEEIKDDYNIYEIEAWENDEKIAPWFNRS